MNTIVFVSLNLLGGLMAMLATVFALWVIDKIDIAIKINNQSKKANN